MTQNSATSKAIPTRYAGYHFRSRLEARWAVFFDSLKVKWEFEPQGYELPSGNYLPDFKVIDLLSFNPWEWFEVKGTHPTVGEIQLLKELCAETGTWGTFLGGIPDPVDDVEPAVVQRHRGCPSCRCETRSYGSFFRLSYMTPVCPKCVDHDPTTHHVNPDLRQFVGPFEPMDLRRAFSAARSARFEHGHSGAS